MSQKTPKIAALTAIGLTGWMLPLATPLPLPLEGFSLAMGLFSSAALSAELKRETIVSGVKSAERKLIPKPFMFSKNCPTSFLKQRQG